MPYKFFIDKYNSFRKQIYLHHPRYQFSYAFAGVGQHSLANLYPCLEYLQVPLKYILSRHIEHARKIAARFPGSTATDEMNDILADRSVRGVLICSRPSMHFSLTREALKAGKHVFVEKPPCRTLNELKELIALDAGLICMTGLQRRFGAINRLIYRHRLTRGAISYTYRYHTGPYPEGHSLTELFIHPLDNIVMLFGETVFAQGQKTGSGAGITYQLMVQHANGVKGMIELSTQYSWAEASEELEINTAGRVVQAQYPHHLKTIEKPAQIFQLPLDKILRTPPRHTIYFDYTGFSPLPSNNSFNVYGFYPELAHFLQAAEAGKGTRWTGLRSLLPVYGLIDQLEKL